MAIFGIFTFGSKIDDFKKTPFGAFKGLVSRSNCRKRAFTTAHEPENKFGSLSLRPLEVENFSKNQGPNPCLVTQKWPNLKNRFGQNSATKIAFELKIILGCGIRLFWRHVKFGSFWTRSKNFDFRRPPQKGTFRPKSAVSRPSHMCVRETLKMLFLVGR